ncbi:hypothetical protein N9D31_00610 [Oligoflexaceae bacterium]|nr:hypothetical protein [Oligoflexaceae bacterium]
MHRALLYLLLSAILPLPLSAELRLEKVSELHTYEAFRGHLAQNDHLFIGKRMFGSTGHHLVLLDTETEKEVAQLDLPHSARGIYAIGNDSVLVVGAIPNPWRTFATEIKVVGGKLELKKTHAIPEKFQIDKFALVDGKWFFNERGDRAIISKWWRTYKKLKFEISGPDKMVGLNDELWAIESRGMGHGDESLLVYNTRSKTHEKLILNSIGSRGISNILALPEFNLIAIDDSVGGRLIALDAATRKVKLELEIGTDIRGLASYGRCIAALRTNAKEIVWTKITDDQQLSEIARWDISGGGQNLDNPIDLTLASGKAFVRSLRPCPLCDPSVNYAGVFVADDPESKIDENCL